MSNYYDFIIIGAGGSGLASALFLNDTHPNAKIHIVCKTYPMGSHTTSAKGGINASLGNITLDTPNWHIYDTQSSGKGLSDLSPTQRMCNLAPNVIDFLTGIGVEFDKTPTGKIDQRTYGGQTTNLGKGGLANRACFVKDHTGHAIMQKLCEKIQQYPNITFSNYTQCLSLQRGKPHHIITYNMESGNIVDIASNIIIFATGGFSQIYQTTSTSTLCTGCGHRILLQSGFAFKDIELVQFHPTGLKGSGILISEACRSQGAYLMNHKGERFMEKIHPRKELAPRDIITKAIYHELQTGSVFLDLTHIPKQIILEKLISSYTVAKYFAGVDISQNLLPIEPTAHYNMGGILVDENYHAGDGIYAIGELACASVHGANRLGCNSLLELFTSAKIVAQHIQNEKHVGAPYKDSDPAINIYKEKNSDISTEELILLQQEVQTLMQQNALICKNEEGLQKALTKVDVIYHQIKHLNNFLPIPFNTDFICLFETQSLVLMAKSVLHSAIFRKHSIGAHFREDFPNPPQIPQHTIMNANFDVSYADVL